MDHSPGQGQYRNLDLYYKVLEKYQNREIKEEEFAELLEKQNHKDVLSFGQMKELCELAHANGIAVASHDDDTKEKLQINEKIGVDISEFPINIETAKEARQLGFYTVVGAPNILLGGSHSGHPQQKPLSQAVPMFFAPITIRRQFSMGYLRCMKKQALTFPR